MSERVPEFSFQNFFPDLVQLESKQQSVFSFSVLEIIIQQYLWQVK
jgi:hypothetical protein